MGNRQVNVEQDFARNAGTLIATTNTTVRRGGRGKEEKPSKRNNLRDIQRSAKVFVRGCEKFVSALAYLFCPTLPGSSLTGFAKN